VLSRACYHATVCSSSTVQPSRESPGRRATLLRVRRRDGQVPPLVEILALVALSLALLAMTLALIGIPFRDIVHGVLEIVRAMLGN
jgi:hypothetical protein